jgi:hypothetical protein
MTTRLLKNKLEKKCKELFPKHFKHYVNVEIKFGTNHNITYSVYMAAFDGEDFPAELESVTIKARSIYDLFNQINQKIDGVNSKTKIKLEI